MYIDSLTYEQFMMLGDAELSRRFSMQDEAEQKAKIDREQANELEYVDESQKSDAAESANTSNGSGGAKPVRNPEREKPKWEDTITNRMLHWSYTPEQKEEVKKALAAGIPKATILTYFYPETTIECMKHFYEKKEIDVIINKITDFREVNMFSVKYKSQKYKVTLKNKIRINLIKILLFIKRMVRRGRVIIPKNLRMYILLSFCWSMYGIIVYYCGIVFRKQLDYKISDVVWELKNSYFTSVILAIFISSYGQIEKYKDKLSVQHTFYTDMMWCFEKIFTPYIDAMVCYYCPFYNEKCLYGTLEYIEKNVKVDFFEYDNADEIIEDIFLALNKVEEAAKNNRIVGIYSKENLEDLVEQTRKALKKCSKDRCMNLENLKDISRNLLYIVAELRRPWR